MLSNLKPVEKIKTWLHYTSKYIFSDNVHTVAQFMDALNLIKSDRSVADVGIAAMTSLPREKWADARKHLLSLSKKNVKNLHQIESAVHVLCLDSATPTNLTDIMRNCMTGDSTCR